MTSTDPTPNPSPVGWIKHIRWDSKGLVPVIAQEQGTGDVLMFAWMNREALQKTAELGQAVYFSRSRTSFGTRARSPATCKKCMRFGWTATTM